MIRCSRRLLAGAWEVAEMEGMVEQVQGSKILEGVRVVSGLVGVGDERRLADEIGMWVESGMGRKGEMEFHGEKTGSRLTEVVSHADKTERGKLAAVQHAPAAVRVLIAMRSMKLVDPPTNAFRFLELLPKTRYNHRTPSWQTVPTVHLSLLSPALHTFTHHHSASRVDILLPPRAILITPTTTSPWVHSINQHDRFRGKPIPRDYHLSIMYYRLKPEGHDFYDL